MAGRRDAKTSPTTAAQAPAAPPYYIATRPLFIGGSQFNRAHNVGDRVPPDHVEEYGWHAGVRLPDGYEPPPSNPTPEPETATGQATSKEGDV
ncbi:hypothetical protein ACIBQX_18735 [Nonomuraea sp. NPDC049714]|uniref:hypothetical protein n=1 Tax=Nonomuraea sp. NPDC049714 TaxID=3364357 RepID=UPI0037AF6B64